MKKTYTQKIKASAALCLLAGAAAMNAKATVLYFDPSGASAPTTGSTYTWNTTSTQWATTHTLTVSTIVWNSADAACFTASSGFSGTLTVDVAAGGVACVGLYDGALNPDGVTLTIQGGPITMNAGTDAVATGGSDGAPMTILSVMQGAGAVETQSGDSVYFYAANTYTGGTILDGAGGVNFNNNTSFGTGTISLLRSEGIIASQGSSALTLANAVSLTASDTLLIALGSTAPVTLIGNITGAGNLIVQGAGSSLTLTGTGNTYTGTTTINSGKLIAVVANAFASSSSIVLHGGTLAPNGFSQANAGTLSLTASSTIDYGGLAATMSFANSSALTYSGSLAVVNFNPNIDVLQVGTSSSGLTSGQLSDITEDGAATMILSDGDVVMVPEPTSLVLGALGGLGMLWMVKRRKNA